MAYSNEAELAHTYGDVVLIVSVRMQIAKQLHEPVTLRVYYMIR